MMASMPPAFTPHPGAMQQHPGVPPGHPGMAPGMAHNPSQPGVQPGGMPHQLAHMGVSGPGPQVNPALMAAGIPPGAGPNPHQMQHLNPQAQQLFQQQQMNPMAYAANNQALIQQQRMQLQQRQLMAQQGIYGNMGAAGIPMGMHISQVTPAHLRAMGMNDFRRRQHPHQQHQPQQPPHPALMAQQIAMQQQQQVHNSQLAQGQNPNQPGQPHPQLQGMPPGQIAAMQAAQVHAQQAAHQAQQAQHQQQQAQQAQQQQAQQQQQQGQPPQGQQPQAQPQPPQVQGQQPQPPQGPQQPQTPQPPQGQPGPTPNLGQNQGQNPGPGPQPGTQQIQAPQPPILGQPNQTQAGPLVHQTQQLTSSIMMKREVLKGHCLLKLMQFMEHLSGFPGSKGKDDLSYWNDFVHRFFSPKGVFRHSLHVMDNEDGRDRQYEIGFPTLARYFNTHFDSGVKSMQLILDKGMTDKPLPNDCHFIENQKASLQYWFEGGSHVVATGTIRVHFDAEQKILLFEFICSGFEEYISRRLVIEAAKPNHLWIKEWHKVNSQDTKASPEMSKKSKARQMKSPQVAPPDLDLPQSLVQNSGVTKAVYQFLEISEIMGQMNPLFDFCHANPSLHPYSALEQYVQININGAGAGAGPAAGPGTGHQNMNGQAMPQQGGPRTPSFSQFPMGASPHAAHLPLPGSPHVGSPAPGAMAAPPMQMQQSQQGTSSSGPSANTSPAGTKRRRPSGVKTEDETNTPASAPTPNAGPQLNGIQAKTKQATPRMQKRLKGNPPAS